MTTPPESPNPGREENVPAAAPAGNGDSTAEESISRFAGPVSLATLISRVAGFFRDLLIAKFFGAAMMADAFFVAFAIPNLFRRMFMEGALSSSFLPVYSEVREQSGARQARKFAGGMLVFLVFAGSVGCVVGIWFAEPLMRALAPGFSSNPEKLGLAAQLTRIMFPFIIFIGLWAVAAGMLNAARRFFVPAFAPALQNVVIIIALLLAGFLVSRGEAIRWLAWAVVIGGAAQFFFQLPFMGKLRILPLPSIPWRVEGVGRCLALMGPAALGGAIFQVNVLVDRWLASFLVEGSISYLYYANRLVQLPHGILSLAVVSAVLPVLSDYAAKNRENSASGDSERNAMLEAGRLTLFITIPSTFGLIALAHPIMEVIFERGAFTQDHTVASAAALQAYAAGLMFFGVTRLLAGVFHARLNTSFPVRCANIAVLANVALSVALMFPFGFIGLALATSCSSALNAVLLLRGVIREWSDFPKKELVHSLNRLLVLGILTGLLAYFVHLQLVHLQLWDAQGSSALKLVMMMLEVSLAACFYIFLAKKIDSSSYDSWCRFTRLTWGKS
ncbi:MAG: murein biosynthesis integral membrane protein MurJ [Nitrospinae bacterium]|nr:murein biosynthesis integral membrane protein MurJ [Nitrospinota bacterium]